MSFQRIISFSILALVLLIVCTSCKQPTTVTPKEVSVSISSWSCDINNKLSVICKVTNNTKYSMDYITIGIAGANAEKTSYTIAYGTVYDISPGVEHTVTATSANSTNITIASVFAYNYTFGSHN